VVDIVFAMILTTTDELPTAVFLLRDQQYWPMPPKDMVTAEHAQPPVREFPSAPHTT